MSGKCVSSVCKEILLNGVFLNVSVKYLNYAGYATILNEAYSFTTTANLLQSTIRSQCQSTSRLCVGGADPLGKTLQLVACGACLVVTSETVLEILLYWKTVSIGTYLTVTPWSIGYFTVGRSFGYTSVLPISQNSADTEITTPEKRLSSSQLRWIQNRSEKKRNC